MRVRAALLVLVAVLTAQASMQQDDAPVTLRSDTRVVQIDITVRDSHGRPVENLKAPDFTVIDNGKPRSFTIFSPNTQDGSASGLSAESPKGLPPQPSLPPNVFTNAGPAATPPDGHSTIILLDAENGWFENYVYGRKGILALLAKLPADEKIALYVLVKRMGLGVLQEYTLDRSKIEAALAKFVPRGITPAPLPLGRVDSGSSKVASQQGTGGVSTLTDAPDRNPSGYKEESLRAASENVRLSFSVLAQKLRNVPGRKSVFWISQGFPPTELQDEHIGWNKTIAALNDANVSINTVDSNGLDGPPPFWGPGQMRTLQQIADETGGQAYHNSNSLDVAMASAIADARSSYTLGFYLTEMDGEFHSLKVNVNRPHLDLNYRQGYYARTDAVKDASDRKSPLQAVLLNPSLATAVTITARLDIAPGKPRATLNTRLILGPEPLSLKQTSAGYTGKVEELFLELDAAGRQVGRYSDMKEFTIKTANKAKFDTEGAMLSQAIPLEAKAVKVSIVVRDSASGRTGSLVIPLDKVTH